jgi:hypothetical protein
VLSSLPRKPDHVPQAGLGIGVQEHLGGNVLQGRRARPGAKYNEDRAFSPRKATAVGCNRSLFQLLTQKIRYLADQWKINGISPPINELEPPYQAKNNGIRAGCENKKI